MAGGIEAEGDGVKAVVRTLGGGVANENAGCGAGLEFVIVVMTKPRVT